ncbi:MAG: class I SAM-dependent methyltransferase [Opitutaceae bacterium]
MDPVPKITDATVRADFNDLLAVVHYTRAAHELGLWSSEETLIAKYFPDKSAPLLEAGCGAGRVAIALWQLGYRELTAFDFAEELVDQARSLAAERDAEAIRFIHADATRLQKYPLIADHRFGGALFTFNGLMQIPGRRNRRAALRQLHRVCLPGAPLLFTTHDRDWSPMEQALWRLEALRWKRGEQDPRLVEFGDRYFQDEHGRTFMHLPKRAEILADLRATGWEHAFDALRREIAAESRAVLNFSDECRFWVARRGN